MWKELFTQASEHPIVALFFGLFITIIVHEVADVFKEYFRTNSNGKQK